VLSGSSQVAEAADGGDISERLAGRTDSQSDPESVVTAMLEVFKSVADPDKVLYCSTPITTGRRYIEWLQRYDCDYESIDSASSEHHHSHLKEVIEPNRIHAQKFIHKLRNEARGVVVIDPSAIPPIPHWRQEHWRSFWEEAIRRYVTTAYFIDGWQFSNGCVHEFFTALDKGIPVYDESEDALDIEQGIELIEDAVITIAKYEKPTSFISSTLNKIKNLTN